MLDLTTVLVSVISGGVLGVIAKSYFDKRYHQFSEVFALKQTRYKATIILMWTAMHPTKDNFGKLSKQRPDLRTEEDLNNELQLELYNDMLFASDKVLTSLELFLSDKSTENWRKTIKAMRKDLYS